MLHHVKGKRTQACVDDGFRGRRGSVARPASGLTLGKVLEGPALRRN